MSNMEKCGPSTDHQKFDENNRSHSARRKEEKLIADLKSHIPDVQHIFNVHRRIGEGTFSNVFLATLKCHENVPATKRKLFAVKYLIPTSHPKRIERELKCLLEIGGVENIVGVDLCLRRNDSVAFVMPYIAHDKFYTYFHKMDTRELQDYMRNLLVAIRRVHSFGIIHRDVKPSNFLHDRKNQKYLLVDFGLAQNINSTNLLGETSNARKRKASENEETENRFALIAPKRARPQCSEEEEQPQEAQPLHEQSSTVISDVSQRRLLQVQLSSPQQQSSTVVNDENSPQRMLFEAQVSSPRQQSSAMVNDENTSQRRLSSTSIPPQPFKVPLKECNESPNPKNESKLDSMSSALTRHIKSAIMSYNMRKQLQCRRALINQTAANSTKYNTDNRRTNNNVTCNCHGKSTVCNICLIQKDIQASRAGTPGYRPPEVLLKYANQTTAVDMWAIGVIMISILSACYPFFKGSDDFTALAEITTVFGDEIIIRTAQSLERKICISSQKQPLHLRKLCLRLRNRPPPTVDDQRQLKCPNCQQKLYECLCKHSALNMDFSNDIYPESAYDLMSKLLAIHPRNRISAEKALEHPFFKVQL